MWNYSKDDLVKEVKATGEFLTTSGCYDMNIDSIEDKTTVNGAKQVVFKFITDEGVKVNVFYIYGKLNGELIDFKIAKLNQLCGILKVTPDKLSDMQGKKIGVFLKASGLSKDGRFINWDIDGFYDTKTKATTSEVANKTGIGDTYAKLTEKYAREIPLEPEFGEKTKTITEKKEEETSDSFPF